MPGRGRARQAATAALWTGCRPSSRPGPSVLDSGNSQSTEAVVVNVEHWRRDADLAGVRDKTALDLLPADEQTAFRALWSDVATLLAKARARSKPDAACDQAPN